MKREHYSRAIADEHKRKKRIEAEERQKKRNRRTNKEQLAKLDADGFSAKKERAALAVAKEPKAQAEAAK